MILLMLHLANLGMKATHAWKSLICCGHHNLCTILNKTYGNRQKTKFKLQMLHYTQADHSSKEIVYQKDLDIKGI